MASQYQKLGTVKFGVSSANVTVSVDVFECMFKRTFDTIERPASFGSLRKTKVAGAYEDELVVTYASSGHGASAGNLDGLVAHAIFAGDNTLAFEFTPNDSAVGVDNAKITGTCSVLAWESGGKPNELRQTSQTFPVLTSTIATT